MADFDKAYQKVKGNEGGYSNLKSDKGGETYMGISRKYNPLWPGWQVIDAWKKEHGKIKRYFHIPNAGLNQLVKSYYKTAYWNKIKGDLIQNQKVAENFFDMHVNSGKAVEIMQKVLANLGFNLLIDNVMGVRTLAAINKASPVLLNDRYTMERIAHYDRQVEKDPSQKVNYSGWLNRLEHFA